jgi:hypothetical protein
MEFVKMGKQEINICVWELINGTEDDDTWECFKRLNKTSQFVVSLYKKTCKLNVLRPDPQIIQKITSQLVSNSTLISKQADNTTKMISRKKK